MPSFPAAWEDLLWDAVRAELGKDAVALAVLVPAIEARTRRYTDARDRLAQRLSGAEADRDLAARALFFTVADAPKVAVPIAELAAAGLLPSGPLRVLDVGAGCGAMTLGLLAAHDVPVAVTAVDRDARALAILRRVAGALPRPPALDTVVGDVTARLPDGPFDLVLAGTVVNELPVAGRAPLLRALLDRLAPAGALIILEPALRETSRALHGLRDALVAAGAAHVFAPCTHACPCPALADARDWCHEDRPFQPPPHLAALMGRTGLRDSGLKFAYLTLRHAAEPLVPGRALRVVSGPLDSKGVVERVVCGAEGRRHLRLLRRDEAATRKVLDRSCRGDVLLVDEAGRLTPRSWEAPRPEDPSPSPPRPEEPD